MDNDTLDLRGLKCPLPAMLARKALAKLAPGTRLSVLADDPMAVVDVPHMCHHQGHAVEAVSRHPSHTRFMLRAKAGRVSPEEAVAAEGQDGDHPAPHPAAPHRDPGA